MFAHGVQTVSRTTSRRFARFRMVFFHFLFARFHTVSRGFTRFADGVAQFVLGLAGSGLGRAGWLASSLAGLLAGLGLCWVVPTGKD